MTSATAITIASTPSTGAGSMRTIPSSRKPERHRRVVAPERERQHAQQPDPGGEREPERRPGGAQARPRGPRSHASASSDAEHDQRRGFRQRPPGERGRAASEVTPRG